MAPCAFNMLTSKSVPHILERIFFSLDYESFKNCMVASKTWRNILTNERFQCRGKSVFGDKIGKDLFNSSRHGKLKEVESILSMFRVDIDCVRGPYPPGRLAIYSPSITSFAASCGHTELVALLLDKGANPNKSDDDKAGFTPLHWSVSTIYNMLHLMTSSDFIAIPLKSFSCFNTRSGGLCRC